jgi:hypothetical protein
MNLSKRDLLRALIALGAVAAAPAWSQDAAGLDLSAGRAIGAAYRAAHGDRLEAARAILPQRVDDAALVRLKALAAADFREGRIFVYQGWRISETEARLFALLTIG